LAGTTKSAWKSNSRRPSGEQPRPNPQWKNEQRGKNTVGCMRNQQPLPAYGSIPVPNKSPARQPAIGIHTDCQDGTYRHCPIKAEDEQPLQMIRMETIEKGHARRKVTNKSDGNEEQVKEHTATA
jgi:hypothetical protein